MVTTEKIMKFLQDMSNVEILKLRKNCKKHNQFKVFLFNTSSKILKRLIFPYYRLEVLLNCIVDIKENKQYYPTIKAIEIKKLDTIFDKLQTICLHLNIALEKYIEILPCIDIRQTKYR